ncbi:alpha/beta hydrolase [soil metagenome]
MDLESRTDQEHREILGLLPADLFDLSDLAAGIERIEGLLAATPVELPDDVTLEDHHVTTSDGHDLVVRLYRPRDAPAPASVLYWIHGGGLVLGDVAIDDGHCAGVAAELGIVVASVDYRLAPAWPYPTPLDDCHAGFGWLVGEADRLGLDRGRVAIGGGSAGGGLAAGLVLMLRDRGEQLPCFQLLRYPMIDDRNDTPSSHEITDGRVWNRSSNLVGWQAYLGDTVGGDRVDHYAAPARALDLEGVPPTLVTVGALDLFRDEDIAYAQALMRAGVPTELHVHPSSFHGSDQMVAHAATSRRWRRDELDALARALGRPIYRG